MGEKKFVILDEVEEFYSAKECVEVAMDLADICEEDVTIYEVRPIIKVFKKVP